VLDRDVPGPSGDEVAQRATAPRTGPGGEDRG
jgi:hypothetical protein